MRTMKRRAGLIGAIGVAAAGLLLSACAPQAAPGAGSDGDVNLTFWSWRVEDVEEYNAIFDVFEKAHPGVTVEYKAFKSTEYNQILTTGLAGQEGPDVAMVKSYGALQGNVASGGLVPLDEKIKGLDTFDDTTLDGLRGKEDGNVYGVPFAIQTAQVFYNKKIFADHKIEVPATWDEFIAASKTLKKAGVTPVSMAGGDGAVLTPIAADVIGSARYGGRAFEEDLLSGKKKLTDPDYVASLQLLKDLQSYLPEDVSGVSADDAKILFSTERAAMFPSGIFDLGVLRDQNPDLDIGLFDVPVGDNWASDKPLTPGWVDGGYGVAAKSPNQKAALELTEWMGTKEFGQMFADKLNQLSPVPEVTYQDPLMQQMADAYADHGSPYLMLVDFRYGDPWGTDLVGVGAQQLWLDKEDAAGAAKEIQKGIDTWFEPGS